MYINYKIGQQRPTKIPSLKLVYKPQSE